MTPVSALLYGALAGLILGSSLALVGNYRDLEAYSVALAVTIAALAVILGALLVRLVLAPQLSASPASSSRFAFWTVIVTVGFIATTGIQWLFWFIHLLENRRRDQPPPDDVPPT